MHGIEAAVVLYGPGDLRLEPRRVPEPTGHEVLIRVSAVGICGSDVHYFEDGFLGANVVDAPHILGHEVCGQVVACGEHAARHRIGTRVVVEPGAPCGTCVECGTGRYNLCGDVRFLGSPPVDGALRRHMSVHEELAFPVPDEVSDETGTLIEPLAVGLWACRRGSVTAGHRVLIVGAGPIGLLAAAAARSIGAEVVVVDPNERRLELARRFGLQEAWTPDQLATRAETLRADVLIDCSGSVQALNPALAAVRPAGTVVVVGMTREGSVALDLDHLQRRELTVVGSFRYANCFPEAIALAASGRIPLEAMITSRYPLQKTALALTAARRDPGELKSLVLLG